MKKVHLEKIQQLVLDIIAVERKHRIPNINRQENVVEHAFSVAMLCWKIFNEVKPPLDLLKIFKYALVHDFSERGYKMDVNTYAKANERKNKKDREILEIKKLCSEFKNFDDLVTHLKGYEKMEDAESLFVWSVDKMQAIVLGGTIDNWWPYSEYGVSFEQFSQKTKEFVSRCSPYVKEIFTELLKQSYKTYYDQPKNGR